MPLVTVRPMSEAEFDEWQDVLAEEYAAEQVAVGRWAADGAVQRARDENLALLPDGVLTPRMLVLSGVVPDGSVIGRAWVALDHPRGAPDVAYLYDIEIHESARGQGLGRALLDAVEQATRDAGGSALELNVFGSNSTAISLYSSSGYSVTTQQMRKSLSDPES